MRQPTEAEFLKDVSEHKMEVIRDDGEYRHVRFKKPGTYCMQFDLVTWPGYLAYSGDMGCYVFSRIRDMFEFFRTSPDREPKERLHINLGYWAEKIEAQARHDGIKQFSLERFHQCVRDDSEDAPEDVKQEIELELIRDFDDEHEARQTVMDFEHDGWTFQDFWEHDCTEYVYRYIWCCYALAWGIRQYDAAKSVVSEETNDG